MFDITFIVSKESPMYENHFAQKSETYKFRKLGCAFIDKYFPDERNTRFAINERLSMDLTQEDAEKYASQLMKNKTPKGLYSFRLNSSMNLLWVKEVVRHINISRLDANCFWWMYFPGNGKLSVAMWDDSEGHVYGHYESEFIPKEYKLPDGITVIKLSEYYAVKERYEELCSKLNICTNAGPGKYEVVYADHNGAECSKTFDIQNVDGGDEVQRKLIAEFRAYCAETGNDFESLIRVKIL